MKYSGNFPEALKAGGTLVINDFVLTDAMAIRCFDVRFAMLLRPRANAWRQADYQRVEAGFGSVVRANARTRDGRPGEVKKLSADAISASPVRLIIVAAVCEA
jgi:hypothetical protein